MWLLDVALGKTLLPGWFAMGSLPVLHGSAALAIKQLLPVMQTSGLPIAQALAASVVGNPLDPSKLALSAVLASMVMHLGTFYTFLAVASLDGKGIDNANPRETQRAVSGSLKGRLLAAHQNQAESFPYFAAAVLGAASVGLNESAQTSVAALAWLHICFRIGYWLFYAADVPNMRTAMFVPGFQCCVFILLEALK